MGTTPCKCVGYGRKVNENVTLFVNPFKRGNLFSIQLDYTLLLLVKVMIFLALFDVRLKRTNHSYQLCVICRIKLVDIMAYGFHFPVPILTIDIG